MGCKYLFFSEDEGSTKLLIGKFLFNKWTSLLLRHFIFKNLLFFFKKYLFIFE